ncbi:MAG: hypothetical protein JNM21_00655 [Taibaiella sp.]|nr:hypothetical protein [Taibaiella sp.]
MLIVLFLGNNNYAQKTASIDSLLLLTHHQNHKEGNVKKALETAYEAIRLSKKAGYERGLQIGYYTIAVFLADTRNFEKSIEYIEKSKLYRQHLANHRTDAFNLLLLEATNNYELGFYSVATTLYNQAKEVILQEKDVFKRQHSLLVYYINAHLGFEELEPQYEYYLKGLAISKQIDYPESFPKEERLVKRAELFEKMGYVNLKNGHLDSARYYYEQTLAISRLVPSKFLEALALASIGLVAEEEGEYSSALIQLSKAEDLLRESGIFDNLMLIYGFKQRIYNKIGATEKERDYLLLQRQLKDSLDHVKNKGRDNTLIRLISQQEEKIKQSESKGRIVLGSIIVLSVVLLLFVLMFFKKYKRKKQLALIQKEKAIAEKDFTLKENKQLLTIKDREINDSLERLSKQAQEAEQLKEMILQKEQEARSLQLKLNSSFVELIDLAKSNHPQFWLKFNEAYPEVKNRLIKLVPGLKVSELTLAAYIYLGFSTKEIADYTFKSPKTIENNRSNLRKKFNVPQEDSFAVWLNNLQPGRELE